MKTNSIIALILSISLFGLFGCADKYEVDYEAPVKIEFAGVDQNNRVSLTKGIAEYTATIKVQGEIMHFYEITALSDCVPGAFGILEPAGEEKDRITTPGFMLVPGLAFDKNGNRLGYGGGFYDKYLASHEEIITAALGYDFQIVEKVPSEPHDKKMDYLIY